MARKEKAYMRLPGKGRSFLGYGYQTLWIGADHLLAIDSKVYTEDYKRFYYKDIEALIVRKTPTGAIWNTVFGTLTALFALLALALSGGLALFFWILAGVLLSFVFINWLYGPTCVCHIQTAVQREPLPSLRRLRRAKKVLRRLRPLIERVQGRLTSDNAMEIDAALSPADVPAVGVPEAKAPIRHEAGRAHAVLFSLLLTGALFTFIALLFHDIPTLILSSLVGAGVAVCVIIALVKQHNTDISDALRTLTWVTLGFVGVSFVLAYVLYFAFIVTIDDPAIFHSQWELLKAYSGRFPLSSKLTTGIYGFLICSELGLGLLGLIVLRHHQKGTA